MYSKYGLKLVHLALTLPYHLGLSPIYLDLKSGTFYSTKQSRLRLYLVILFISATSLFLCGRTLEIWWFKGGSANPYFHISYAFSTLILLVTFCFIFISRKQSDISFLMNQLVRHCLRFERKWMRNYDPMKSLTGIGIDTAIIGCMAFFGCAPFVSIIHYLLFPQTPIFLPTVLPEGWGQNPWVYWGYALVPAFYSYGLWQFMLIAVIFALLYIFSVLPLICSELRVGSKGQLSTNRLRTVWILPSEYRAVELLHKQFLEIIGYPYLVLEAILGKFILFCNFSYILHRQKLDVPTRVLLVMFSISLQITWMTVLEISGRLFEHSKKTLRSWSDIRFASKNEKKYMSRFRKGCSPLRVGTVGVITVKRLSGLKFMRATIKGTFRALIIGGRNAI